MVASLREWRCINSVLRVARSGCSFTALIGKGSAGLIARAGIRHVFALEAKAKLATDACVLAIFARRGRFERRIFVIQSLGSRAILL